MKRKVNLFYFFEGILILMTLSMIFLLVGCTKKDLGMDGPITETIQEESADWELLEELDGKN